MLPQQMSSMMNNQRGSSDSLSSYNSVDSTLHNDEAVVVVTPYSTGCCLAREMVKLGYTVICLWNEGFSEEMKKHVPISCEGLTYFAEVDEQATLQATAEACQEAAQGRNVISVVCGGEAGVDLADALSEHMGLLSNGTDVENRRDKKVQHELIREKGMRACRQAGGREWTDVEEFLRTESYPLIVKPVDSAGSDGVKLCHTFEQAKKHFFYLRDDHDNVNGGACSKILCQEFLKGREYVVDQVSLNGVHKTVMMWVYDKRPANGGSFVYFGDQPIDSESEEAKVLMPYARQVLDALGVKHGPSHGEFIITEDGPCLVEMNCRCHGGDGIWQTLCNGLTGGMNQIDASVFAYLDQEKFMAMPNKPPSPFNVFGQCVDFVSFSEGIVNSTPGYDRIKMLPSFVHLESHIHPGSKVVKTIDMATEAGNCILMHRDPSVLEQDIAIIRALERANALFDYEEEIPSNRLERKFSVPKDPNPVFLHDAMPPSMYLERKLSTPKDPNEMYIEK